MATGKTDRGGGKIARIGRDAVRVGTGKTWSEWLRILDRAGASRMDHQEIARYLAKKYQGIGMWWHQMVTVGYEQARGLREKYQRPDGYGISSSRTLGAPASTLFKAWKDPRARLRWLPGEPIVINKATPNRSIRLAWGDGTTRLEVMLYPKGRDRCQMVVQHGRLKDAATARRMKAFWKQRLDQLQEILES